MRVVSHKIEERKCKKRPKTRMSNAKSLNEGPVTLRYKLMMLSHLASL